MYLQTGHENEWLRHLRQAERRIRRETNVEDYAASLTSGFTETQAAPVPHRVSLSRTGGCAARLAAFATVITRWPTKATNRP